MSYFSLQTNDQAFIQNMVPQIRLSSVFPSQNKPKIRNGNNEYQLPRVIHRYATVNNALETQSNQNLLPQSHTSNSVEDPLSQSYKISGLLYKSNPLKFQNTAQSQGNMVGRTTYLVFHIECLTLSIHGISLVSFYVHTSSIQGALL